MMYDFGCFRYSQEGQDLRFDIPILPFWHVIERHTVGMININTREKSVICALL